jgi:ABC-type nickel/cobalt efflux system permease component RcnA
MRDSSALLLVLAVGAVGVLHTLVPDHWAPITLLSRQQGWTRARTLRAAALAGTGHTVSTLTIAVLVWFAGVLLAVKFGEIVSALSSAALIAFGTWIAVGSLREMRRHGHTHLAHAHLHRHPGGLEHRHWHEHHETEWHADGNLALVPIHEHEHRASPRTALLLILGSSPMIEGIPAFFAASRYGVGQLLLMALVFGTCTIATYAVLCDVATRGVKNVNFGRFERYGEVLSGAVIAALGLIFIFFPSL